MASGFEQAVSVLISNSSLSGNGRGLNTIDSATLVLVNNVVKGHAGPLGIGFITGVGALVAGTSAYFKQRIKGSGDNNSFALLGESTVASAQAALLVVGQSAVTNITTIKTGTI